MFLEIRGIKKSFGTGDSRVNVLKGLDLNIEKGQYYDRRRTSGGYDGEETFTV